MRRNALLLSIFTLSGAAGLIYEIVWSRQLVLVFGNTTQAISAILTGFFAGLAIGAIVGGRLADRVRSPLRMYGILELLLVAVVLLTPFSFRLINEVYRGIYPSLEGTAALPLIRLMLAVLALSPATIMMGATFPSLVRHFTRSAQLSQSFGRLYAANTLGAILGTLLAGLVLIEILGLSGALTVGAGCSLVAGLSAVWLSRNDRPDAEVGRGFRDPAAAVAGGRGSPPSRIRLALVIAFISGLTSLGYQVTWTRLLASGTGNFTYVFTVILAVFLAGIAIGAVIFNLLRPRLRDPLRLLSITQVLLAAIVIVGLVTGLGHPNLNPGRPIDTVVSLVWLAIRTVLPATIILGVAFPTASALLHEDGSAPGTESGSLLAVNTTGAILGSLVVPFILMPTIGSPAVIALLAAVNATLGIALALASRPRARPSYIVGVATLITIVVLVTRSGLIVQPNEYQIEQSGGKVFASTEDEIASVQAGQLSSTPELWVAGTSMTLLTVDAKLMPILPLIARPNSTRALIVAFGMGTAFRAALIAGLRADVVELVPSVPKMFGFYYPDAAAVLANPNGKLIIADGRNHLELTSEHFDIIVTDPPPPSESSGASVISSLEYYQAGRAHLTPGGIMMQWTPYGTTIGDLRDHMRTFRSVFSNVLLVKGPGGYGFYMLGSDQPFSLDPDAERSILNRPGVLADISSAYDSPAKTMDEWLKVLKDQQWLTGTALDAFAGVGPPFNTDDHPRAEYFLLRRLFGVGASSPQ